MFGVDAALARNCSGINRRQLLKVGALGLSGLTLADALRIRETRADAARSAPVDPSADERAVILVWLDGGPPHHETYDPKPGAPVEVRGPLGAIDTAVPGVQVSDLLPLHARVMDRASIIRSMHHKNGDHFAAAHWMLTGHLGSNAVDLPPQHPSAAAIITRLKGPKREGLPPHVALPTCHSVGLSPGYHGGAYLGVAQNPFIAHIDPNQPEFQVPNLNLPGGVTPSRMDDRRGLLHAFDNVRRDVDRSGLLDGLDAFQRRAYEMVTGPAARAAFDLSQEDPRLRDRYGRHRWGQSALLARRLVEAGTRFVTLTFDGWDWHSEIEPGMKRLLPIIDAAIATLIEDLDARGLLQSTIVVVMGEFGRTPRINETAGRDHWGDVMSVLVAGGGLAPGIVVGSSNPKGEYPKDRPVAPADLLATLYVKLGIPLHTEFQNNAGRPIPIAAGGTPIRELL